jgi:hypothetical protein
MHRSARRAGYPSDSSRAERQQFWTRPAGGGPLHYNFADDRLRQLRHRSGHLAAGRCHPCAWPGAGPGEKPSPPLPAAAAGQGAVPHCHRSWAAAAGSGAVPPRGLLNPGRGTRLRHRTWPQAGVGAVRTVVWAGPRGPLTVPHVADQMAVTRAFSGAGSPDCSPPLGRTPRARLYAVGVVPGRNSRAGSATERPPRTTYSVWSRTMNGKHLIFRLNFPPNFRLNYLRVLGLGFRV